MVIITLQPGLRSSFSHHHSKLKIFRNVFITILFTRRVFAKNLLRGSRPCLTRVWLGVSTVALCLTSRHTNYDDFNLNVVIYQWSLCANLKTRFKFKLFVQSLFPCCIFSLFCCFLLEICVEWQQFAKYSIQLDIKTSHL